jgi:hypothetical protein
MKWNIHKLADFLEKEAQAGVAIEHKILEWKLAEARVAQAGKVQPAVASKAS